MHKDRSLQKIQTAIQMQYSNGSKIRSLPLNRFTRLFFAERLGSVDEVSMNEVFKKRIEILRVLFAECLGSVDEVLMNEVFKKCIGTLHALFAEYGRAFGKH